MSTGAKEKLVYEVFQLRKVYVNGGRKEAFFQEYNLLTLKDKFEILSNEDEEIDIEAIEELAEFKGNESLYDKTSIGINREMINILIKAVKQINREVGKRDE